MTTGVQNTTFRVPTGVHNMTTGVENLTLGVRNNHWAPKYDDGGGRPKADVAGKMAIPQPILPSDGVLSKAFAAR